MRRLLTLASLATLIIVGSADAKKAPKPKPPPPPPPVYSGSISLNPTAWGQISFLKGTNGGETNNLPLSACGSSLCFSFPVVSSPPSGKAITSDPHFDYLHTNGQALPNLASYHTITMTFKLVETDAPQFEYMFSTDNTGLTPANVRLWFARSGWENYNGADMEFWRWWSSTGTVSLASAPNGQTVTVTASLDPSQWTDVLGHAGSAEASQFAATEAMVGEIGVTFGGGYFYGHGVDVTGGTAQFILESYSID